MLERVQTERLTGSRPVLPDAAELAPIMAEPEVVERMWPGHLGGARTREHVDAWVAHDVAHWEAHEFTLPHNAASRRVMERLGFVYERDIVHAGLPHVLYLLSAGWSRTAP